MQGKGWATLVCKHRLPIAEPSFIFNLSIEPDGIKVLNNVGVALGIMITKIF